MHIPWLQAERYFRWQGQYFIERQTHGESEWLNTNINSNICIEPCQVITLQSMLHLPKYKSLEGLDAILK